MKSTEPTYFPGVAIESTSDLAKRLNLSRWTISRVINGHDGVSASTALRVKEAMRELGFSPNPLARGLRKGKTNIIGICLPEIEGLHLGQKLEFLRRSLTAEGYHVMVGLTNGDRQEEAETLNRFRTLHATGVILFASQLEDGGTPIQAFLKTGIPLVSVDPITVPIQGSLCVDRAPGMREAMRHLFELGHRRVATLGLDTEGRYFANRMEGVKAAYRERGWNSSREIHILKKPDSGVSDYQNGLESAPQVWEMARKGRGFTAVLAINDRAAIGLIDGLRTLGIRVPEDLSVIGYDNMEVGAYMSPRLTSIDAQPDELVRQATERLLSQIRLEKPKKTAPPIRTRLIVRNSTGPARDYRMK